MLGKVKEWLGIEGVKLELVVPPNFNVTQGTLQGVIRLQSMRAQTVNAIRLEIIEKYSRGRDDESLVDEYSLGTLVLSETIDVPAEGEPIEVPFLLEFTPYNSPIDEFGQKNVFAKGLAWVAKKTRNAVSEYRLEAQASVKGVALDPFDKKVLE
ncbi:MAG: sporulation-control protein spo0M [Neolewinella sp.]|jgi:sporulation-control protein spo0M